MGEGKAAPQSWNCVSSAEVFLRAPQELLEQEMPNRPAAIV